MITGTGRQIAAILLVFALPLTGVRNAAASSVDGTWIIKDLVLNIFDCQSHVCGRIVWIKDAARRPTQCGRTIVWGLEPKARNQWDGGSILDPDDNNVYRLTANFEPDGTLRARIFKGVPLLGKTEVLRRVDVHSLTGLC
jgi:uncharacterized protein (DUF2147 family)